MSVKISSQQCFREWKRLIVYKIFEIVYCRKISLDESYLTENFIYVFCLSICQ